MSSSSTTKLAVSNPDRTRYPDVGYIEVSGPRAWLPSLRLLVGHDALPVSARDADEPRADAASSLYGTRPLDERDRKLLMLWLVAGAVTIAS